MNSEYDINNYTNQELENIFGLPKNYDLLSLMEKETKLRQNIHVDKSIDDQKKIKTLLFIDNAKNKLADVIKLNINMFPKSQETTNFSNSQLKQSDVTREGTNYIIKHPNPVYTISYPSETQAGDLNPLNRRILNNYLCIDSRFRDNYYTTQSSNFNINLPVRLTEVVSIQMSTFEFTSTYYVISRVFGNNFFMITIENENKIITVPDGNYTATELVSYLNNYMSTLSGNFQYITFIYDLTNNSGSDRMIVGVNSTYGDTPFSFSLNFLTDIDGNEDRITPLPLKFGWKIGFRLGSYVNNDTYVSEGLVDLQGPRYIYLVVDDFNNSVNNSFYAAFNNSVLNKNILARIVVSEKGNTFVTNSQNNFLTTNFSRQYFGPVNIQKLNVQLLDEYGRTLNLNNMDYSFSVVYQCIYNL
jgi:hypothetical protein